MSKAKTQFSGFANTDESEVVCFCTYEPGSEPLPLCRKQYHCSEAYIAVRVLPNSRPSDEVASPLRQANRQIKKDTRKLKRHTEVIKKGVANLEKSIKHMRFKV